MATVKQEEKNNDALTDILLVISTPYGCNLVALDGAVVATYGGFY